MTNSDLLKRFSEIQTECLEIAKRKNGDYASEADALANLKLIEVVSCGRLSAADGILTRVTDKLARFGSLLSRDAQVADESIADTLNDLANYAILCRIALENK